MPELEATTSGASHRSLGGLDATFDAMASARLENRASTGDTCCGGHHLPYLRASWESPGVGLLRCLSCMLAGKKR